MKLFKRLTFILLILSLFIAFNARFGKAEIDGYKLLYYCKEAVRNIENKNAPSIDFSAVNFCVGFISGINEMHTAFVKSIACFDPPVFCAPMSIDSEQLVMNVFNFLKAHPEDLHFQSSVLTISALKEAFPCPYHTKEK